MIVTEVFYGLKCSRCQEQYDDGEHSYWVDESTVIENALESGWLMDNNRHYCSNCHVDGLVRPEFPEYIIKVKKFLTQMVSGNSTKIEQIQDKFVITRHLNKQVELDSLDGNYIKETLGDKLISIDIKKHDRFSNHYLKITIK